MAKGLDDLLAFVKRLRREVVRRKGTFLGWAPKAASGPNRKNMLTTDAAMVGLFSQSVHGPDLTHGNRLTLRKKKISSQKEKCKSSLVPLGSLSLQRHLKAPSVLFRLLHARRDGRI